MSELLCVDNRRIIWRRPTGASTRQQSTVTLRGYTVWRRTSR